MDDYEEILHDFERFLKPRGFSVKTVHHYKSDVKKYLEFHERKSEKDGKKGKDTPSWWKKKMIMDYLTSISLGDKYQPILKSSSIARKRAALVELSYYWETKKGSPIFDKFTIKSPKIGRSIPNYYTMKDLEEIIHCFQIRKNRWELRNLCLVLFLFGTGLRASELLTIRKEQLLPNGGVTNVKGKGGSTRFVFLPSSIWSIFGSYQRAFEDLIEKEGALFFSKQGSPLSYSGLYYIITNIYKHHPALKQNKHLHPHGFRHSFATSLLSGGADIRRIADLMGHSSLNTTQKYTHVDQELLKTTMKNFHPRFS